jgi:hypothetical protein
MCGIASPHISQIRSVYFYDLLGYGQFGQRDAQNVSLGQVDATKQQTRRFAHYRFRTDGCDKAANPTNNLPGSLFV